MKYIGHIEIAERYEITVRSGLVGFGAEGKKNEVDRSPSRILRIHC